MKKMAKKVEWISIFLLLFIFLLVGVVEEETSRGRGSIAPLILAIALAASLLLWTAPWKKKNRGDSPTLKHS